MNSRHPWGPGVTLDAAGPTRDVKVCMTPTDEAHVATIRRARGLTRSAAIREALASYVLRLGSARNGKKKRERA